MRVLVIGCGSIGKRHIRNLIALGQTVHTQDLSPEIQKATEVEYDLSPLGQVDAVVVATPPDSHLHYALKALEDERPVFVEKPISDTMEGVSGLLGTNLLVGYNLRYHWGLQLVHRMLPSIGKPISVRAEFGQYLPDWRPWQDYRSSYTARLGIILDASHEIDYLRWLFGEVRAVSCVAERLGNLEVQCEDTAEIILQFVSGTIASIHLDFLQSRRFRHCRIVGASGTLVWRPSKVNLYLNGRQDFVQPGTIEDTYIDEMRHFIRCAQGWEKPRITAEDGIRVLEIALAAKESARLGKVIRLDGAR